MSGVTLSIDQKAMQTVVAALKAEADGKALRTELNKSLKAALEPAKAGAATAIRAMPTKGASDGSMREAMATSIKLSVNAVGARTGVNMIAPKGAYPRGFKNAAAAFNHASFRRPTRGRNSAWVSQVGAPGWFDNAATEHQQDYKEAVEAVILDMANRIAARSAT